MEKFRSIKECMAYLCEDLENGYCLISSDFKDIYTCKEDLPKTLSGTYISFRSHRCKIFEIKKSVCSYTDYTFYNPNVPDFCKELNAHKIDIICGYYFKQHQLELHQMHEYVDLGLPSGVKWATKDVSTYITPSKYAWGEVKTKPTYTPKNALKRTKFANIKADPKMDTGMVNWGGKWRMPTIEEYEELLSACEWRKRGYGYDVIGPNGNSIFFFFKPWCTVVESTSLEDGDGYWTCISKEGEDKAACFRIVENTKEISWIDSYMGLFVRPVFSEDDSEHKEIFKNDPYAEEFRRGIVEVDGKYKERFVYVGEQSHKGGNRATAKGFIKTGDIVDITFLGASEQPIRIRRWNPMWETDESVPYMGEDYFFEVVVNSCKKYIGKYGSYRETKSSKMGGCLDPTPDRDRITQETIIKSFNGFKEWLLEGAKKETDWHFLEKPSDVECPIPDGLPAYPEPEDTTPDAPVGYKCVLLEESVQKGESVLYGKQFLYNTNKLQAVSNKEARGVIASGRIGGGEYLDWEDDAGFGNAPSFADYINCKGLRYAVVSLDEALKDGLDKDGNIVSEQLYKSLLSSSDIEWLDVKEVWHR